MDQARFVARQLGLRIRAARQLRKLTLQQLGADTNLSAAYLSRIERGETATSIANLISIATRLNVPLRDLFEDTNEAYVPKHYSVSRKKDRTDSEQMSANGYDYHWLSGDLTEPRLNAFLLEFPVVSEIDVKLLSHEGEEVLYILEGRIEFQIGADRLTLDAGDCVHLLGDKPHMGRNVGNKPAKMLMVVTPSGAVDLAPTKSSS
ncbi:XRE family transcriptional regulator [Bradyrhizobium sp. AT1]|uniref:helix-turn-helix domain-containing protein n=1 Tax=Bradyrhizobium sp. AT1 TaxID=574934 RepID=UPI0009FDB803|nr:XRE family transcriptional regulator [Bradyrhizobium sp. AT1]